MIWKELDPFPPTDDPLLCAGRRAEEQMAYYLRRAFADSKDIAVLNGVRLEHRQNDGTSIYAQIDHLVVHRSGMVAIESKSVSGTVRVNERGEWMREWGRGEKRGMPSPILQAKAQMRLVALTLDDNASQLIGKFIGLQVQFGSFETDVLVAISDNGIIDFPPSVKLPEVGKADQIPQMVRQCIEHQKKAAFILRFGPSLTVRQDEMENICHFLINLHQPLVRESLPNKRDMAPARVREAVVPPYIPAPTMPTPAPVVSRTPPAFACSHCSSDRLAMVYGQYGYYLKCSDCAKNTRVEKSLLYCDACQGRKRIRKERENFYVECSGCAEAGRSNFSQLLYTNPRGVAA